MELLIIGIVLGVGASKTKAVTKAVAKGYMTLADKTKSTADGLREDMRDAIEEVRTEQDENALIVSDRDPATETLALQEAATHPSGDTVSSSASTTHSLEAMPMDIPVSVPATGAAASTSVVVSSQNKKPGINIMKSLAKGYIAVTEKTRNATASFREDMRDAIEEARYERSQEIQRKASTDEIVSPLEMTAPAAEEVHGESSETTSKEISLESNTADTKIAVPVVSKSAAPTNAAKKGTDKKVSSPVGKKSAPEHGPTVHKASDNTQTNSKKNNTPAESAADIAIEIAEFAIEAI